MAEKKLNKLQSLDCLDEDNQFDPDDSKEDWAS